MALKNKLRKRLIRSMINKILSFFRSILKDISLESITIIIKPEIVNKISRLCTRNVKMVRRRRKINLDIGLSLCIKDEPGI
jgi:hypothetical protein